MMISFSDIKFGLLQTACCLLNTSNSCAKRKPVEGGIQEGDWVIICTGMNKRWGENDDSFAYGP